ncbi:hypothetical protein OCF84_21475 (plasmid) [Shewanella xiamenensis]|uniref:Uncharacterized protein n=1 Tax=Shewanella xiamenensis TaxID=332186 RepID=A0ABT6UDM9_9GAMM|nr:hypothetical protein [Shewanella xiamenensis]MDI5832552.1 hypothetical protein [Shewanella xiamenensis]WHF57830.1 hypothetical protein OCF84_21475 [Shewanella xiamenensis]
MNFATNLYEMVRKTLDSEPLVIYPAELNAKNGTENYWVVTEQIPNLIETREIIYLENGDNAVSEAEGPQYFSCPKFFFELVPEVRLQCWRLEVLWWHLQKSVSDNVDSSTLLEAFQEGMSVSENGLSLNENPHPKNTILHIAFTYGWGISNSTY